ncbi:MAG: hypothetical protein ACREPG_00175 [Candidatus Binatia bacterium]
MPRDRVMPHEIAAEEVYAEILEALDEGALISYDEADELDDEQWARLTKTVSIIEIPGEGYKAELDDDD